MSIFRDLSVACPACGTISVESVAVSLNGPRVPEIVQAIVDGSFHRFSCPACGCGFRVDGPLIYTDFERKHWIGEFPLDWETSWAHLEHQPLDSFRRAMIDLAPAYVRAESSGFVVRTVFGLRLRDVDCDFRLMRRDVFDRVSLTRSSGVICVELMKKVQDHGFRIAEVPVHHFHRSYGRSQFFNFPRVARTLVDLARLWVELVVRKEHLAGPPAPVAGAAAPRRGTDRQP